MENRGEEIREIADLHRDKKLRGRDRSQIVLHPGLLVSVGGAQKM
jgi:hypothetical protein